VLNGERFRFLGANAEYLFRRPGSELREVLDRARGLGSASSAPGLRRGLRGPGSPRLRGPFRQLPAAPGMYNETAFERLDRVIAEASRRGLRLIVPWPTTGPSTAACPSTWRGWTNCRLRRVATRSWSRSRSYARTSRKNWRRWKRNAPGAEPAVLLGRQEHPPTDIRQLQVEHLGRLSRRLRAGPATDGRQLLDSLDEVLEVSAVSHDRFYRSARIKQWYKEYVSKVVTRVNTVTGVAYRDDPTIMAWELANEPRARSDPSGRHCIGGWWRWPRTSAPSPRSS